jgi:hypothetical protein
MILEKLKMDSIYKVISFGVDHPYMNINEHMS